MKNLNSVLFKSVCCLSLIFMIQACDNEFSEIGTGIVGTPDFEIKNGTYPVKTYNKKMKPFQSNGLSENLLGYYYDPVFGDSKVDFVGQLTPKTFAPDFGDDTILDSVVLTVPYKSTIDTETMTYTLDYLYGSDPIKLSIFKNNYYLRTFDPNADLDAPQNYYSNGTLAQGELMGTTDLEGQLIYQDNSYFPSADSIDLWEDNEETDVFEVASTLQPSLRVHLFSPTGQNSNPIAAFWDDLIFSKEEDEVLSSSSNFYEYFRGLYFKAESITPMGGNLMQLDFSSTDASVTIYYTYEETVTVNGETSTITSQGEYEMNFTGNRVNIFDNTFNASVTNIIDDTTTDAEGDDYLYLKGGEGSMAIVELFADEAGNSEEDQLNEFREVDNNGLVSVKRLINEAYLEFYIDETQLNTDHPNRVYLYDLDNNIPMTDFFLDQTVNTASADSKFTHLVPLSTETSADGTEQKKYKIRLTEHLNNIIIDDSTNVKLGLVVSSNVGSASPRGFQTSIDVGIGLDITTIEGVPTGTVLSPKSVVLHGSNSPNVAKRVKLNIYYTEPRTEPSN
ncbi:DUF4270 domain-containing protein [Formosa sp. Hel1_33_131]|uniref:DUF4270 domain-containing protein n=1 Tax=Formosa sp. Hel1_33_131 TaxID=1336794 RepID=UPI0009F39029|nr:DUF4270 domain-containing protein [Formosa sp. Hel1_33_131]